MKYGKKECGHNKEKQPKQGPTSANDLAIELLESRYYRLD